MRLLTQNVLSYPESLETAGILRSACCFAVTRDNNMITFCRADRVEEQVRAIREREEEQKRQRRMMRHSHSIVAR